MHHYELHGGVAESLSAPGSISKIISADCAPDGGYEEGGFAIANDRVEGTTGIVSEPAVEPSCSTLVNLVNIILLGQHWNDFLPVV